MMTFILAALLSATEGPALHDFALIFRPTRSVAADDLSRRNAAARDWALKLQRDGILRFAAPLEPEGFTVSDKGISRAPTDPPVASVLVVKATSLEAALSLVKTHPGLTYGTSIEVRPLKSVTPP